MNEYVCKYKLWQNPSKTKFKRHLTGNTAGLKHWKSSLHIQRQIQNTHHLSYMYYMLGVIFTDVFPQFGKIWFQHWEFSLNLIKPPDAPLVPRIIWCPTLSPKSEFWDPLLFWVSRTLRPPTLLLFWSKTLWLLTLQTENTPNLYCMYCMNELSLL